MAHLEEAKGYLFHGIAPSASESPLPEVYEPTYPSTTLKHRFSIQRFDLLVDAVNLDRL